ncbi:mechanosensitive ion channel family protein [Flocculibacter collagenilyticus]|uniref:mechanosensitive ion channel family protein n=1 Tax=Flocculibacter collagenilyticus TaxID=2744479 RepID=UPI0018F73ED8|nr:mechanosensitive ion channel domain-containing protein [Flocculibacter collagenilyticus]
MESALAWIMDNRDLIITFGIKVVVAIFIVIIGKFAARGLASLLRKSLTVKNVDEAIISFLTSIVFSVAMVAILLMALSHVGIETTSLIAVLGAAGLAVGLALKDSLSNFASGVMIIVLKPFRAGDWVEAGGVAGTVREIKIFSTIFTSADNKIITVPNAQITEAPITNFTQQPTRRVDLKIGVSYDSDLKVAKEVLTKVVTQHEKVLESPAPVVAVQALADSSVNFVVRPWVNTVDYWAVYFDLHEQIKLALDAADITIPYPQMDVHLSKND